MKPHTFKFYCLCLFFLIFFASAEAKINLETHIAGVKDEKILENISARLKINLRPLEGKTTRADIHNFYQKAPAEIKEALQPFGYFNPRITPTSLRRKGRAWHANFKVLPGRPVKITEITLHISGQGQHDKAFLSFKHKLPIKVGDRLNTEKYEDTKQDLYEIAQARGYFDASMISSELLIDLEKYSAAIHIHFDSGPRYRFGFIRFSKTPLTDAFLRRFPRFKMGDPYQHSKIKRLQQDLSSRNYFRQVLIGHEKTTQLTAPVNIQLTMRKRHQYTLGLGYDTDMGIRGLFGITDHYINRYGHQFKAQGRIAKDVKDIEAVYTIPGKQPANEQYDLTARLETEEQTPGKGQNQSLAFSYLSAKGSWQQTLALILLDEKFTLHNQPERKDTLLIPSITLSKAHSDDSLRPSKGYQINLVARGASRHVLGKHSFFQTRVDARFLTPLTPAKNQRVLLRGAIAHTHIDNIFNLPLSLQYYGGGANELRGFPYQSIGPGKLFFFGSAEIQQRIKGDWFLALFYDVGNVANNRESLFRKPPHDAGFGVVYLSPVGEIQLSFAKPLNHNLSKKEKEWRIAFSIGPEILSIRSDR